MKSTLKHTSGPVNVMIPPGAQPASGVSPALSLQKPSREIAAPYQTEGQSGSQQSYFKPILETTSSTSSNSNSSPTKPPVLYPDYTNMQFQGLEKPSQCKYSTYVGPTPESNWVIPGKLLVGAYPASEDDAETLELISSILKLGVTKFVCLQQEYREHGVTEEMWRSGQALRPYFHDVRAIVRKKHLLPVLNTQTQPPVVTSEGLSFVHCPIRDCGITDDSRVLELARLMVKAIAEGEVIYLHCWGGHGRTGTLVCIMLHLMYGYSDTDAMYYCQTVHDLRQCPVVVGSPQTQTQRKQVSRVIHLLQDHVRRTGNTHGTEHTPRESVQAVVSSVLPQVPIEVTSSQQSHSTTPPEPASQVEVDVDVEVEQNTEIDDTNTHTHALSESSETMVENTSNGLVTNPNTILSPRFAMHTTSVQSPQLQPSISPTLSAQSEVSESGNIGNSLTTSTSSGVTTNVSDSVDSLASMSSCIGPPEVNMSKHEVLSSLQYQNTQSECNNDNDIEIDIEVDGDGEIEEGSRMRLGTLDEGELQMDTNANNGNDVDVDTDGEEESVRPAEGASASAPSGSKPSFLPQWRQTVA